MINCADFLCEVNEFGFPKWLQRYEEIKKCLTALGSNQAVRLFFLGSKGYAG